MFSTSILPYDMLSVAARRGGGTGGLGQAQAPIVPAKYVSSKHTVAVSEPVYRIIHRWWIITIVRIYSRD